MDNENINTFIRVVQEEHKKIDERWLRLHHKTIVYAALVGLLIESIFATALFYTDINIELGFAEYLIRYILLPVLLNTGWILFSIWSMHNPRLTSQAKAYMISIALIGICFVFYSAHYNYDIGILFFAPVLFTVIYGNYQMAAAVAAMSLFAKIISDLCVTWNTGKIHPFTDSSTIIGFIVSTLILILFYAISMVIIYFQREKDNAVIQKEIERYEMQQQLLTDDLTKIPNRGALRVAFDEMEADTSDILYYFAMADLDNFKTLNDTLGHEKGDQCLEEVGRILMGARTEGVTPFRFAGDEFCILFKNKTLEESLHILQNIQDKLRQEMLSTFGIPVTISIGVARYSRDMTATQLLQKADTALYQSKERKDIISISEEVTVRDAC
ncbi:MAG: GGDEF domain-containing protein [Muricomes sp.]